MVIDSHHHYWNYNPVEYDWIDDKMKIIRKDFLPNDLKATVDDAGVDGVITVQARQLVDETDWLLKLASKYDFMRGVVGWLPIADAGFELLLDKYASVHKLVALRHVIQGEPDDNYILRSGFNEGISHLKRYNLTYDILVFERHLQKVINFVDMHPNQTFVLDHIAKPLIKDGVISPWKENIEELAKRDNVFCKISGMVTEADFTNWNEEQLKPYFDVVLNAFTPSKLMFGSDWPVCLVGVEYHNWVKIVQKTISKLSGSEQQQIMGLNALKAYHLD
ncbi:MAG: amidohydrolase family protein [Marinilabiliaceae bacterium]|nr:amidohydrolase family protein [Marinilabiliaceae bacterium]